MWRNGRRNGLKIRWALTGPCRFESGHRHTLKRRFTREIDQNYSFNRFRMFAKQKARFDHLFAKYSPSELGKRVVRPFGKKIAQLIAATCQVNLHRPEAVAGNRDDHGSGPKLDQFKRAMEATGPPEWRANVEAFNSFLRYAGSRLDLPSPF